MVEWQLHKRLSFNATLGRIEVNSAPRLLSMASLIIENCRNKLKAVGLNGLNETMQTFSIRILLYKGRSCHDLNDL